MATMSNVTLLPDSRVPNEACIALCEELLAKAKAGEIKHVATVVQYHDDVIEHAWSAGEKIRQVSMLGGIEALKMDYWSRNL